MFESIEKAEKNPIIKSIVITAKGRTFPAGADISEFASGKSHSGKQN